MEIVINELTYLCCHLSPWQMAIQKYCLGGWVAIRPGTRLFNNWRLIEYLKEATRSARLGTRSVLGAAGKVEI